MRIFFAINLPKELTEQLSSFIDTQKNNVELGKLRWVKPEHLHITLRFLAHIEKEQLMPLIEAVNETLQQKHLEPFVLQTTQIIYFPKNNPRVLSLGISQHDALSKVVEMISIDTELMGFPREKREYLPHLTLARFKETPKLPLPKLDFPISEIPVNEIVLYKSKPTSEGSHYTKLHVFKIG